MKTNSSIIASVLVIVVFLSFLGLPIPDWFAAAVSSLAGTITATITGFSNLISFVQLFVHF